MLKKALVAKKTHQPTLAERVASVEHAIHGNGSIGLREQIENLRHDMREGFAKLETNQQRIQEMYDRLLHQQARILIGGAAALIIVQLLIRAFAYIF